MLKYCEVPRRRRRRYCTAPFRTGAVLAVVDGDSCTIHNSATACCPAPAPLALQVVPGLGQVQVLRRRLATTIGPAGAGGGGGAGAASQGGGVGGTPPSTSFPELARRWADSHRGKAYTDQVRGSVWISVNVLVTCLLQLSLCHSCSCSASYLLWPSLPTRPLTAGGARKGGAAAGAGPAAPAPHRQHRAPPAAVVLPEPRHRAGQHAQHAAVQVGRE